MPEQFDFSDRMKLSIDIVKHLTTLASGSIVLVSTFVSKTQAGVYHKGWIITSISFLLISLLASITHLFFGLFHSKPGEPNRSVVNLVSFSFVIAFASFFGGIVYLGLFALTNF